MKKSLRLLVLVAVALVLTGLGALLWKGLHDQLGMADAALVLGNTVDSTGKVSDRLKARLDRVLELYRDGYCQIIIVSGGTGKEGFPEGTAMQHYLISKGVPEDSLVVDNLGVNTWASALNTRGILKERNLKSVLVVTQYFHIPRSRLALEKAGISPVYSSYARYFELRDLYGLLRELSAYVKYRFIDPPSGDEKR